MFQIDLASNGELQLILPDARRLDIPATAGGITYIKKVLKDHHDGVRNQRGYIGTLPTQHAVDKAFADEFLRQKREKSEADRLKVFEEKTGIDLGKMEIRL